jgi:hypothetical protein
MNATPDTAPLAGSDQPRSDAERLELLRAALEQVAGVLGAYVCNPLGEEAAQLLRTVLAADARGEDPTNLT